MIFGLTDETYSLVCTTDVPEGVQEDKYILSITLLDQLYWIAGSVIGSALTTYMSFNAEGIEFAMTALFLVLFIELWMKRENRPVELVGMICALVALVIFGETYFVLAAMLMIIAIILVNKKRMDAKKAKMSGGNSDA